MEEETMSTKLILGEETMSTESVMGEEIISAKLVLGEETKDKDEALMQLRSLVVGEENLYVGTDERTLLVFLCWANFDVDLAFEKMKGFYKFRADHPEWCAQRRVPEFHDKILQKGVHQMLDTRDQLGRRVYILRLGRMVYGEYEPNEMFQIDDLWGFLAVDEEETRKNGLVILADFKNMSWKFLKYYTPHNIKISARKIENLPFRNWQFHSINAGVVLHTIVTIVFPFLSQSLKEKLFFHKNLESLHAHVSPSALPKDYGGERPPIDNAKLIREYLDPRNARLNELLSFGYQRRKSESNEDEEGTP